MNFNIFWCSLALIFGINFAYGQGNALPFRYAPCSGCPNNLGNSTTSQTIPNGGIAATYGSGGIQEMDAANVASDFGRREVASRFHLGVDFTTGASNTDYGDAIYPIDTGKIIRIKANTSYKRVFTEGSHFFGYGHIFNDNQRVNGVPASAESGNGLRAGDFFLKMLEGYNSSNPQYGIVYMDGSGGLHGFAEIDSSYVVLPSINNGDSILCRNVISDLNVPIVPLGNSGGSFAAHVHLYSFENTPTDDDVNGKWVTEWGSVYNTTHFRNPKDPLQYIRYDAPQHEFTFYDSHIATSGSEQSEIKVRVGMENATGTGFHTQGTYDVDDLEILIKPIYKSNSAYKRIKGPLLESYFSDGSRDTSDRYPSPGFPAHIPTTTTDANFRDIADRARRGSWTIHGIEGNAYRTRPADDYYYNEFYHRIRKNDPFDGNTTPTVFARSIEEARYIDGKYHLGLRVIDVTGDTTTNFNEPDTLEIDNFLPYIKRVDILTFDSNLLPLIMDSTLLQAPLSAAQTTGYQGYKAGWVWDTTSAEMDFISVGNNGGHINTLSPNYDLAILVEVSEPLDDLTIMDIEPRTVTWNGSIYTPDSIALINPIMPYFPPVVGNDPYFETFGETRFLFLLGRSMMDSTNRGFHRLVFEGKDASDNDLLGYERNVTETNVPSIPHTAIPIKQANGSFTPARITATEDKMHGFLLLEGCFPSGSNKTASGCLDPGFYTLDSTVQVGQSTVFIDTTAGGNPPFSYYWDFGAGASPATSSNASPGPVSWSTSGLKTITLTVEDNQGEISSVQKQAYINVYDPNQQMTVDFFANTTRINQGGTVFFQDLTTDGTPPYTYSWDFGDGSTSTQRNPAHTYSTSGWYTVSLTVQDQSSSSPVTETKNSYIEVTQQSSLTASWWPTNVSSLTAMLSLDVQGGSGMYRIDWQFGDGNVKNNGYAFETHTYNGPGTYTVTVQIRDVWDPSQFITTFTSVTILTPPQAGFTWSPAVPSTGMRVDFTNWSNTINLPGYQFQWHFDDPGSGNSNYSNSIHPNHTYSQSGDYDVTLTAWGPAGSTGPNNTITHTITVVQSSFALNDVRLTPPCYYPIESRICNSTGGFNNIPQTYLEVDFTSNPPNITPYLFEIEVNGGNPIHYDFTNPGQPTTNATQFILDCHYGFARFPINEWIALNPSLPETLNVKVRAYANPGNMIDSITKEIRIYEKLDLQANGPYSVCYGGTVQMNPSVSGGSGDLRYEWSPQVYLSDPFSRNPEANPPVTTQYRLTVTDNQSGCSVYKDIMLEVGPPNVDAGPDRVACVGKATPVELSITGGTRPYTINWNPMMNVVGACPTCDSVGIIPAQSGFQSWSVTVTDASGCTDTDRLTLEGRKSIVDVAWVQADTHTCEGEEITLIAAGSGGRGAISYRWVRDGISMTSPNTASWRVSPSATTLYEVFAVDTWSTCRSDSPATVIVRVTEIPAGEVDIDERLLCPGASTLLTATGITDTVGFDYWWEVGRYGGTMPVNPGNSIPVSPGQDQYYFLWGEDREMGCQFKMDSSWIRMFRKPEMWMETGNMDLIGGAQCRWGNGFESPCSDVYPFSISSRIKLYWENNIINPFPPMSIEAFKINQDGSGYTTYPGVIVDSSGGYVTFPHDEFEDDTGEERYFLKFRMPYQICPGALEQIVPLCMSRNSEACWRCERGALPDRRDRTSPFDTRQSWMVDVVESGTTTTAYPLYAMNIESSGLTQVPIGQETEYYATGKVILKPGFRVPSGGKLKAKIIKGICNVQPPSLRPRIAQTNDGNSQNQDEADKVSGLKDQLFDAIPNPTQSSSRIPYYIAEDGSNVEIRLVHAIGTNKTILLSHPDHTSGYHQTSVEFSHVPAGVYIYQLIVNGNPIASKKLIYIR